MDPEIRNTIENYIDKLREELLQEIQGMNSESAADTAPSLGLGSFEASMQESIGGASKFNQCAK
ncbi:MAG TPA: hypothetical protein VFD63_01980 [Pyrinomonadaceae bacterium]|jgi:hypothetical protein|nr:hypothetical protein [Pyrinomonadaceae bacterium]